MGESTKMRRADREVRDRHGLGAIYDKADACRVTFAVAGEPYIATMNFGYEWAGELPVLYFHCAREGRKLEAMRANPRVCFALDADHELVTGERPCDWGMKYASIVGYGELSEVDDEAERERGLDSIMRHYGWPGGAPYDEAVLRATKVLRLRVSEQSGKRRA
jgi:nitroimidazol reductase NimA-like FMN-containing flavoprotein (pyridoxamine 5'-phosphate oxidase superfamily)